MWISTACCWSTTATTTENNRRKFLSTVCSGPLFYPVVSNAAAEAVLEADSKKLEAGLLNSRVTENLINPPPYGMEDPDVYYPSWFNGVWKVESTTKQVLAPCGKALFGGNATYDKAMADIGNTLRYESRFVPNGGSTVIADREYNVRGIAKAAMGTNSVVDVPLASPNKLTAILAPQGSPGLLKVDLLTINRRQEVVDDLNFDCSESVREIVSPVGQAPSSNPNIILKEIETTSLYTFDPKKDLVRCTQRSAAFLLPSQVSPMTMSMYQASRGRAVDVRFYDVTYTKR